MSKRKPHDYRRHLGCILPRVPATIVRTGAVIEPKGSLEVTVRLLSSAGGEHAGALRLHTDAPGKGTLRVPLRLDVVAPTLRWDIVSRHNVAEIWVAFFVRCQRCCCWQEDEEPGGVSSLFNSQAIDVTAPRETVKSVVLRVRAGSAAALRLVSVASTAPWAKLTLLGSEGQEVGADDRRRSSSRMALDTLRGAGAAEGGHDFAHLLRINKDILPLQSAGKAMYETLSAEDRAKVR